MSREAFTIAYDGPALRDGVVDIHDQILTDEVIRFAFSVIMPTVSRDASSTHFSLMGEVDGRSPADDRGGVSPSTDVPGRSTATLIDHRSAMATSPMREKGFSAAPYPSPLKSIDNIQTIKEDNKWRLFDGNGQITVTIDDADFLRKVNENQVPLVKGDILICDVRTTQKRTKNGLRTEYIVQEVIEQLPAAYQLSLS